MYVPRGYSPPLIIGGGGKIGVSPSPTLTFPNLHFANHYLVLWGGAYDRKEKQAGVFYVFG